MNMESVPLPKNKSIEVKTWGEFKKAVDGWMWLDDDYCVDCFKEIEEKNKGDDALINTLKMNSTPIIEILDSRRISDGWLVECAHCKKSVFRPKSKEKESK